jgi:Ca2+-binding RTX toxin-like protein/lysophospholipase L1-like esterase
MRLLPKRRRGAVGLTAALVVAATAAGQAPAQAAETPSIWQPSPPATIEQIPAQPFKRGGRRCIPDYSAEDVNTGATETACAVYGGHALLLSTLLDVGGVAAPVYVRDVGHPRYTVLPIDNGDATSASTSTAWMHSDCTGTKCVVRFSEEQPGLALNPNNLKTSWVFDKAEGPALGQPVRDADINSFDAAVSAGGRYIAALAIDGTGLLWHDREAGETRKIENYQPPASGSGVHAALDVSPSGRYVAVGGSFMAPLRIYDMTGCATLTSDEVPGCRSSSVTLNSLLGIPSSTDLGQVFDVSFFGEDELRFRAKTSNLPGGSDTEFRWFSLRAGTAPPPADSIFVMGDSFTAGEGAGDYMPGTDQYDGALATNLCHHSNNAWPKLLAGELGGLSGPVMTSACSGATTDNIRFYPQWEHGGPPPLPGSETQMAAYRRAGGAGRLLVQIGGNDALFADIVVDCIKPGDCSGSEDRRTYALRIQRAYYRVRETLKALRTTDRLIALVGYPAIVDDDGACDVNVRLNDSERQLAMDLQDYIDASLRKAALTAGAHYISLKDSIEQHQLCDAEPWVNGVTLRTEQEEGTFYVTGNESFHPDARAHRAFAQAVASQLNALTTGTCGINPCPFDPAAAAPPLPPWAGGASGPAIRWKPDRLAYDPLGITSEASGLKPGTSVLGEFRSTPVPISPVTVDEYGQATIRADVPPGLEPGWHTLHLTGTAANGAPLVSQIPLLVPGPAGDRDGDAIPDAADLCPTMPGDDEDRIDGDGDGIGDPCDGLLDDGPLAGTTCSRAGTTLSVVVGIDKSAALSRTAGGVIQLNGGPCADGTVSNVDLVKATSGGGDESLALDLAAGGFAPGATTEAAPAEIELEVDLGAGTDQLAINGTPLVDTVRLGSTGINLNNDKDRDVIRTGVERVQVDAGAGNDTLSGEPHASVGSASPVPLDLRGDAGNDKLTGGARGDTLFGLDGTDTLAGAAGDDSESGGEGNDTFKQDAAANGGDDLAGDGGTDKVDYALRTASAPVAVTLNGFASSDDGAAGEGDGVDVENVTAGAGADMLTGDAAKNALIGGLGNDVLDGGDGIDTLTGGKGDDVELGGEHNDTFKQESANGADDLIGEGGVDKADYAARTATEPIIVTLDGRATPGAGGGTDGGTGEGDEVDTENVTGGKGDDQLIGDLLANLLAGGLGADLLSGLGGNDQLKGDAGADRLFGGEGNDKVDGGADADTCDGGAGKNTLTNCP